MRILVTPLGVEEIESLKRLKEIKGRLNMPSPILEKNSSSRSLSKNRDRLNSNSSLRKATNSRNSRKKKTQKSIDIFNRLEVEKTMRSSVDKSNSSRELNIKQRKLQIGKPLADTYIKDQSNPQTNFILPILNIPKKSDTAVMDSSNESTFGSKYTIKDVLNEESYNFLKTNYQKQQKMKDRLSRVDETKFRSVYKDKNYLEKLEEKLNNKIDPDKLNLLKYLNERKQIGEIFLDKIVTYDEERVNKMNKICQIVFHNEENAELMKGIIKEKLKIFKNKEKIEYKSKIESMGRNIENISELLKNYDRKIKKQDKYKDLHKDMLKYWKNHNIEKFTRKGKLYTNSSTLNQTGEAGAISNFNKTNTLNGNLTAANQTNSIIKMVNSEPWELI